MNQLFEKAALVVVLLMCSFLIGCNQPLPNSISYRCDLSGSGVDVNRDFGAKFSGQLSAVANLRFTNDTPVTGVSSADTTYIVELESKTVKNLSVSVVCDRDSKTVAVMIRGNTDTEEAKDIGQKAVAVFSTMVPGKELRPFVARQGLLGP